MSASSTLEVFREPALVAVSETALSRSPYSRELAVVLGVLSRFVGESANASAPDISMVCHALNAYAVTPSHLGEAVAARPPLDRCPDANSTLRRRGLTRADLARDWKDRVGEVGPAAAHLDLGLLTELVPPQLWPTIAWIVSEGPGCAVSRIEIALQEVSQRSAPLTRARPEPSLMSASTVKLYATAFRRILTILVEMRSRQLFLPDLEPWSHLPRVRVPRTAEAHTDTSAPDLRLLRTVWRRLNDDLQARLGVTTFDDELTAAATIPIRRLERGVWPLARTRALVLVLLLTGTRVGAALDLRVADYTRLRLCPLGDRRPTLDLRPGKTLSHEEIRRRALPVTAGRVIDLMLVVNLRLAGRIPPDASLADEPGRGHDPQAALFPGTLTRPMRPWCYSSVWELFSGRQPWSRRPEGSLPLFPRPVDAPDEFPRGYSPHRLRGAALQLVRNHGPDYCQEHGLAVDPEAISEVLLDHNVRSDRYGYADINTKQGRERWCAVGAEINWETLDGERGAVRVPDTAAYEALLVESLDLELELARIKREFDGTVQSARGRAAVDSSVLLEVLAINEQRSRVEGEFAEVRVRLTELRTDESTWVTLCSGEEPPDEGLEAVERRVLGRKGLESREIPSPVREWLTVTELAETVGVSPATARRWVRGTHLPRNPGDPRRPWEPDGIPVDRTLGDRRQRIWLPGVKPGLFSSDLQRASLAELVATWPSGWSKQQCMRPVEIPSAVMERLRRRKGGGSS